MNQATRSPELFEKLQNTEFGESLIQMQGSRKISIAPEADTFSVGFWPDDLKEGDQLDLEEEKLYGDLIFSDLIQDLDLKPSRFGICSRSRCNNFFYQYTGKKKEYCSVKCGTAERQSAFQKKEKKENGED